MTPLPRLTILGTGYLGATGQSPFTIPANWSPPQPGGGTSDLIISRQPHRPDARSLV
jgi:hypothetical protein